MADVTETVVSRPQNKPKLQEKPEGWWSLRDMSGSISGVSAAVDAAQDIPDYWKVAIKADLQTFAAQGFNFVYLDAHFMVQANDAAQSPSKRIFHYDATPDKKLL